MRIPPAKTWRRVLLTLGVWLAGVGRACLAHDVPPSVVTLDIGASGIVAELQLPLGMLESAAGLPPGSDSAQVIGQQRLAIARYVTAHFAIRGGSGPFGGNVERIEPRHTDNPAWSANDWVVVHTRWSPPAGVSTETFSLEDSLIVHRVLSQNTLVYVRRDVRNGLVGDQPMAIGLLGFGKTSLAVDGSAGSWRHGFTHLAGLGMRHIAEGTDHLLFLLTLLLPAPLLAAGGRWRGTRPGRDSLGMIVRIVSGFTIGHSLTLALGAMGWGPGHTRGIEVLVAVSILVSSVHAWRPLLAGREVWVAAGFGLVHGLAFAEVLSGLSFDGWTLVLSLLGFNLGIEAMQLLVITVTLPPLLLLARTRAYGAVRCAGAALAGVCALGWIVERVLGLPDPLQPLTEALSAPPRWLAAAACAVSVLSLARLLARRSAPAITGTTPLAAGCQGAPAGRR